MQHPGKERMISALSSQHSKLKPDTLVSLNELPLCPPRLRGCGSGVWECSLTAFLGWQTCVCVSCCLYCLLQFSFSPGEAATLEMSQQALSVFGHRGGTFQLSCQE